MGLFMPLLLGGLAFLGLPWLIHRIRRPTRNPTPFSSLMFVPETTPPLRERKKIEHPWLMLLRMLILAALALAFARPYSLVPAVADDDRPDRQHVVLVDTSLSMNTAGQFEALREAAAACLEDVAGGDGVAVVGFNTTPEVVAPFAGPADPGAGSVRRARGALDALAPSAGATRFIPALQLAEQLLRPPDAPAPEDEPEKERIIHLVSDLQRIGLPEDVAGYSLARGIALRLVPVSPGSANNAAVTAIAIEPRPPGTLHTRIRLRNFGAEQAEGRLQLWLDGAKRAEEPVTLLPESNIAFPLQVETDLAAAASGEVRLLVDDVLQADNVHYFRYQPDPVREIGVLIDPGADRARPSRFLEAAIADSQPLPWKMRPLEAAAVLEADALETLPPVVVAPELDALPAELAERLAAYVTAGGRLLLIPSEAGFPEAVADALLAPAGLTVAGRRFEAIDPERHAVMNWIDYDHPVFRAFRGAAYSDFSMVRFHNYHRLEIDPEAGLEVLARLDAAGTTGDDPAALRFPHGAGDVAVWSFPLDPEWTNITRTRRFIPMLHETIALLLPGLASRREHVAGTTAGPPPALGDGAAEIQVRVPGEESPQSVVPGGPGVELAAAGLLRWYANGGEEPALVEPVNLAAGESDLQAFTEEEFLLRIGAVSAGVEGAGAVTAEKADNVVHWEYGYYVLVVLAAAVLLETGLAAYYSRRPTREQQVS